MTIPLWVIPTTISVLIFFWISYGFDYSREWNFAPLFTLPLCLFLWALTWMLYFAYLYWSK